MKELSKSEKSFIKKIEKMKKDVETLDCPEAVKKIDKAIEMLKDGWGEADLERDRVVNEAFEAAREAFCKNLSEL